jgi:uncharacterized protein YyaL (SSP411 family)
MRKSATAIVDALNGAAAMRVTLLEIRDRRPQPLRDDKIIVGINGLAIDALVRSSRVLRRGGDLEVAGWTSTQGSRPSTIAVTTGSTQGPHAPSTTTIPQGKD